MLTIKLEKSWIKQHSICNLRRNHGITTGMLKTRQQPECTLHSVQPGYELMRLGTSPRGVHPSPGVWIRTAGTLGSSCPPRNARRCWWIACKQPGGRWGGYMNHLAQNTNEDVEHSEWLTSAYMGKNFLIPHHRVLSHTTVYRVKNLSLYLQ